MSVEEIKVFANSQVDDTRAKIRAAREAAGLTQVQLARRAGIDVYGINRLENGSRLVKMIEVCAIAAALGLKVTDLIMTSEVA